MRREHGTQAAMVMGWISTADALFVALVLTLTITLSAAACLQRSRRRSCQTQDKSDMLRGQLAQREALIKDLQADRTRIIAIGRQHIDDLREEKSRLETASNELRDELATSKKDNGRLRRELAAYGKNNDQFSGELVACRRDNERLRTLLAQTTTERQSATIRLVAAIEERDVAVQESKSLRSRVDAEPGLHKELIGLKGRLGKVAVVFDTSGSMASDGRWEQARGVVATWLEHLAINECALVLFSTGVEPFPEDGRFLSVHGSQGEANRRRLLNRIESTKPDGGTNTLLALQAAYRCPGLDTIILFTDGEPNNGESNQFDPEIAQRIYDLCRQHKDIPVNSVGLGNYFKPQLSGFLMRVAQETNGSFLGR